MLGGLGLIRKQHENSLDDAYDWSRIRIWDGLQLSKPGAIMRKRDILSHTLPNESAPVFDKMIHLCDG